MFFFFDQPARQVFMQDAGDQRLIGYALFHGLRLNSLQVSLRNPEIYPLIFKGVIFGHESCRSKEMLRVLFRR